MNQQRTHRLEGEQPDLPRGDAPLQATASGGQAGSRGVGTVRPIAGAGPPETTTACQLPLEKRGYRFSESFNSVAARDLKRFHLGLAAGVGNEKPLRLSLPRRQ